MGDRKGWGVQCLVDHFAIVQDCHHEGLPLHPQTP